MAAFENHEAEMGVALLQAICEASRERVQESVVLLLVRPARQAMAYLMPEMPSKQLAHQAWQARYKHHLPAPTMITS
jgi:hypothetical protein